MIYYIHNKKVRLIIILIFNQEVCMSCPVHDNNPEGNKGEMGIFYFDPDYYNVSDSIGVYVCSSAYEGNTYYSWSSATLNLDHVTLLLREKYLAPGEHWYQQVSKSLAEIYRLVGEGEHSFSYGGSEFTRFTLLQPKVFLFNGAADSIADEYRLKEMSGVTLSSEDGGYRTLTAKDGGIVNGLTISASSTNSFPQNSARFHKGATAVNVTIGTGSLLQMNDGSILQGNISVTGKLSGNGTVNAAGANITLNVKDHSPENEYMITGTSSLADVSSCTITVKADQAEGKYCIASGFDSSAVKGSAWENISFTVDGQVLPDAKYANQYTFHWDESQGKYTGINYNGKNYILSIENGNLNLSIVENVANIFIYAGEDCGGLINYWKNLKTENNVNIYIFADYDLSDRIIAVQTLPDEIITYIGTGAYCSNEYSMDIASANPNHLAFFCKLADDYEKTVNTLIIGAHGNGLCISPDDDKYSISVDTLGEVANDCNISVLALTPCCLMAGIELAYACKNKSIDYIIGTEALTNIYATPNYKEMLKAIENTADDPWRTATIISDEIPLSSKKPDSSTIISTAETNDLFEALDDFAKKCLSYSSLLPYLLQAKKKAKTYYDEEPIRVDIKDFMRKFSEILSTIPRNDTINDLINSCSRVIKAVDECIQTTSDLYGLSCYMPSSEKWVSYPIGLVQSSSWGELVLELYKCETQNPLPFQIKKDQSVQEKTLADGSTAANTGVLTNNARFSSEASFGENDVNIYAVELEQNGTAADSITVSAVGAENTQLRNTARNSAVKIELKIYDETGENLLNSVSGLGAVCLSLNGFAAGSYTYTVETDVMTAFDIEYQSANNSCQDHLDSLMENGNNTKEDAYEMASGYIKGLTTNSSDPDWFYITTTGRTGTLTLDGKNITKGSITLDSGTSGIQAYFVDAVTNAQRELKWNGKIQAYEIETFRDGYLYVMGNTEIAQSYELHFLQGDLSELPERHHLENYLYWEEMHGAKTYTVEFRGSNSETAVKILTDSNKIDLFAMPAGTYQWNITADNEDSFSGEDFISEYSAKASCVITSNNDGNMDVFFTASDSVWENSYFAEHHGIINVWTGTNERISLVGKNKISDIFSGSEDSNVLLLTDDANGDALFVDDIFTALPCELSEQQARLSQIEEIRAGGGNDIIDLTSQRFAYQCNNAAVLGGEGNDTIWANSGTNILFGDAGDDRLVGGNGSDVLIGGSGNDRMHGGGGDDIFTFGSSWGNDTVEQLDGGTVILWFETGSYANWNAETLTYIGGDNSVKVSGVSKDNIAIVFADAIGADTFTTFKNIGAFADAASEKIFEEKDSGMLV